MGAPLQIGRYVLHGEIASGGMATVHYGRLVGAAGFAKTVAIKRLHRALAHNEAFRGMILEEGRLAARVRHPNVVPPLDVLAEGGELLLVMEYVHGESLSRLLRASTRLGDRVPLAIASAILSNVLHGLHAAHEAKDEAGNALDIVHRDVSPQNVLVGVDGVARVIDFGIAKAVTSEGLTSAGTIKGKVPYLSPEQLEGDPATRRTDIYAASVVLWELLAGRRLFEGSDDAEVLRNILFLEVKPPSAYNPLVPGAFDDVVLRGLARAPADRYATAREMAVAIEEAVHLATPTVVGAWAERLAESALKERAEHIKEVEATPAIIPEPPPVSKRASRPSMPPPPVSKRPSMPPPPPVSRPPASIPPPSSPRQPPPSAPLGLAAQEVDVAIPAPPPKRQSMPSSVPTISVAKPSVKASSPPVRPPAASFQAIEPRTVIYEPPSMPEPDFVEGVRPIAPLPEPQPERLMPTFPAANHPERAPSLPPAGALRKPELEIRNVDWRTMNAPQEAPAGSAFRRFLRYLALFLFLMIVVAYMFAPALTRAFLVTNADKRGITLTIDTVEVSSEAVRLRGFHAESRDLAGASVRATTVVVGLEWLRPSSLTVDDAELSLDGSYVAISERFASYNAKHPALFDDVAGGLRHVEVTSGRVDWKNLVGENTNALVENITLQMDKVGTRPIGADYHMTAPLFTAHIADAPAGPWQIEIDRQGIISRAIVRLDPSGSYPATVTRTAADDGSLSLSLQVPPTALRDLHLPRSLFGAAVSDRTRLGAQGEISVVGAASPAAALPLADAGAPAPAVPARAARSASGHLAITAQGINVFPNGPLVDLLLDLPLDGPVAQPIALLANLTVGMTDASGGAAVGSYVAPMVGTLDLTGRAARIVMTGQTTPIPCAGTDPKKPKPTIQTPSSTTGVAAAVDAPLDDYPGSKLSFKPAGSCNPRFK